MLGLNLSLVDETYSGKLPELDVFQTGYTTAFVVVSSVVPVFVAFVAVVAVVADPAEPSMLVPVKLIDADALLSNTAVVPM